MGASVNLITALLKLKTKASTANIAHACGLGIEKRKPLDDPFCYQLGFLDGHSSRQSEVELLHKIIERQAEALTYYAKATGHACSSSDGYGPGRNVPDFDNGYIAGKAQSDVLALLSGIEGKENK
jgi:hypothetical protein